MTVSKLMTRPVVTVAPEDSLEDVQDIFRRTRFHHLLVTDGGRLVGIVSDRDLLKALSPNLDTPAETLRDRQTLEKRVHQVMSSRLYMVTEKHRISDAVQLIMDHGISCVPVVDDHDHPVGILTWRDVLRELLRARKH